MFLGHCVTLLRHRQRDYSWAFLTEDFFLGFFLNIRNSFGGFAFSILLSSQSECTEVSRISDIIEPLSETMET